VVDTDALYQYFIWRAEEQEPLRPFSQASEMYVPADQRLFAIVKLLDFMDQEGILIECRNDVASPRTYRGEQPPPSDFFIFLRSRILWNVVIPGWSFDDSATSYYPQSEEFLGWCRIQVLGSDLYRLSASNQKLESDPAVQECLEDDIPFATTEEVRESYIGRDMNFEELSAHLSEHRALNMLEYVEHFAPHLVGILDVDFDAIEFTERTIEAVFPARFPVSPIYIGSYVSELAKQREALLPPLDDYEFLFRIHRSADTDGISIRPSDPLWQQIIGSGGSFIIVRDVEGATQVEWMLHELGQSLGWNDIFMGFMRSIAQEFEQNVLFCGHLSLPPVECPECGEHVCPACFESEACHT